MKIPSLLMGSVLLLVAGAACADHVALPRHITPLMATWLWGHHSVPGSITRDGVPYWYAYPHTDPARIDDPPWTEVAATHVKPGVSVPAVVFLHGCSGMIRGLAPATSYRATLMEMGFAVIEPDAYARPDHSCDNSSAALRRDEAANALEQLRSLSWIDQDRIVLLGFSEGGRAAALWDQPGFAAIVIIGSRATNTAPDGVPVLAIAGANDSWAKPETYRVNWDAPSRAVLIEGADHEVMSHPAFTTSLQAFLTAAVPIR
jgi:dienelactone hydrolase